VTDPLERALDFARANEKTAELAYKRWAQRAPSARLKSILAELGAAERGHHEMLLHVSPSEIAAPRAQPVSGAAIAKLLVNTPTPTDLLSRDGIAAAVRREEVLAALYELLAGLGGETAALFSSLAAEEQRHRRLLLTEFGAAEDTSAGRGCT
jgi:rubrerythrin